MFHYQKPHTEVRRVGHPEEKHNKQRRVWL
jgi:hypothetical protein